MVQADADERQELRDRLDAMRLSATSTGWRHEFERIWRSHGITKTSTNAEIRAALDAIEPPFHVVADVPEPPEPDPAPVEPERPIDTPTLNALIEHIAASPVREVVNGWVGQGSDTGYPWSPKARQTVTNYERCRAALKLAMACSDTDHLRVDEQLVREFLRAAIGDPAAEWPGLPVGAIIGQLDRAAALRATAYAEAFGTLIGVAYTDNGPRLTGVERVAA